ncbi:MAG: endonuclease III [Robiginitomaculum sp.]|nr:MAG: endonuclease III [Robiginitomaculum sp.]
MAKSTKSKPAKPKLPRPKLTRAKIAEIFARLHKMDPEPKTELNYHNAYTLVVAVALSAQATDVGVNKATKALFARADTPEKMLEIGEDRLRDFIKTIGLYKTKAKNVIAMSQRLVDVYAGQVPDNRGDLESLPGVGRKTANVVLNVAFGQPTMAVDTHIFRVGNRTGMAPGKNPLQVELNLLKVIPQEYAVHAHHWLILHGRYTCKARKPMCQNCVIADICKFKDKTKPADQPRSS